MLLDVQGGKEMCTELFWFYYHKAGTWITLSGLGSLWNISLVKRKILALYGVYSRTKCLGSGLPLNVLIPPLVGVIFGQLSQ